MHLKSCNKIQNTFLADLGHKSYAKLFVFFMISNYLRILETNDKLLCSQS